MIEFTKFIEWLISFGYDITSIPDYEIFRKEKFSDYD